MMLFMLIASTLMRQSDMVPEEAYMPIVLFFSVLLILSLVISYLLHFVYLTDEELIVKRYCNAITYPRAIIKSIDCVFVILCVLKTDDGQKRIFVSRLSQVQQDVFNF